MQWSLLVKIGRDPRGEEEEEEEEVGGGGGGGFCSQKSRGILSARNARNTYPFNR